MGDEVLVVAVDRCRTTLREVDVFGRYGGEEFVIVMPETALDQARVVAERLREGVAAEPVPTSEGPIDVSISIGLAHISQGVDSLTALLDRADAALLTAKRAGRNQVRG